MEIALSHVISHAKALLSTFTSFAAFTVKKIHGGIVFAGEINTFSLSVSGPVKFHTHTGDLLQSFTFYVLPATGLIMTISHSLQTDL